MGAIVSFGGCTASFVSLDDSWLPTITVSQADCSFQFHAGAQPAEGRLSGKDPARRDAEWSGLPHLRDNLGHRVTSAITANIDAKQGTASVTN
jgi:hypothetical protein